MAAFGIFESLSETNGMLAVSEIIRAIAGTWGDNISLCAAIYLHTRSSAR